MRGENIAGGAGSQRFVRRRVGMRLLHAREVVIRFLTRSCGGARGELSTFLLIETSSLLSWVGAHFKRTRWADREEYLPMVSYTSRRNFKKGTKSLSPFKRPFVVTLRG